MPRIEAKIIKDSISPRGSRLTTMECRFHRYILPEFNTYRMWSRSAASSRAIPLRKKLEEVRLDPVFPIRWGKEQQGMVAKEDLSLREESEARLVWKEASLAAADYAEMLGNIGAHKQIANRLLEPFLMQTMVVSSTDFDNMFGQRIHPDAQPEFQELASKMKEALDGSAPTLVNYGQWHLPYVDDPSIELETAKRISVARVARSSYGNQSSQGQIEKDLGLYDRLLSAEPKHWAPTEPIATPSGEDPVAGNFYGWHQLRHLL